MTEINSFPIQAEQSALLTGAQMLAVIEAASAGKAFIVLQSTTVQPLSINQATPTILDNWVAVKSSGVSLQGDSLRNDTGRVISFMSGTIGLHPEVDGGGGDKLINLTSEKSPDGIAPYVISNQNRPIFTKNSAESYNTKESYLIDFGIGEHVRFIAYADTAMSLAPSSALFRGNTTTGPAALWILVEA